MFKNILLPTDGSEGVIKAVNCAVGIALKFDARIHILFIVEPPSLVFDYQGYGVLAEKEIIENVRQEGQRIIDRTVKLTAEMGIDDVTGVLREGSPAVQILQYAQDDHIDLIVMGTHGRRGLNRVILGSVAEEIVRTSPVPVLTVRMSDKEGKSAKS